MMMGSENEHSKAEEDEGEIPVLTVLKNKTVLKNIFIVNKPPEEKDKQSRGDHVDILLVGRHPDCDLMLTHPSISRFHLQIRSKPSSRHFSLLDLNSVHGTWVSGRRIEPMVSVEMKEGDVLRIGVSSRVYHLHWIPISRAYDLENPFLTQLDAVAEEEEEEDEEEEEEKMQNLNCCPAEMEEIESVYSIIEDISSLFLGDNAELTVKEETSLAPWMLEERQLKEAASGIPCDPFGTQASYLPMMSDGENNLCDSLNQVLSPPYEESEIECDETLKENLSETLCLPAVEAVLETKMQLDTFAFQENSFKNSTFFVNTASSSLNEKSAAEAVIPKETEYESECTVRDDDSVLDAFTVPASLDEKSAAEAVLMPKESDSESECILRDDGSIVDAFTAEAGIFNSENMFLPVEKVAVEKVAVDSLSDEEKEDMYRSQMMESDSESECILRDDGSIVDAFTAEAGIFNSENMFLPVEKVAVEKVAVDSLSDEEKEDTYRSQSQMLNHKFCHDQGHSVNEIVQDVRNKGTGSVSPTQHHMESVNLSIPQKAVLNIANENRTLQSDMEILESCVKAMEKMSTNRNIWSRRGKEATSAPQVRTSKSILKKAVNVGVEVARSNKKDLFSVLDGEVEEEEIFTPDKENFSPNTLQLRLQKKKGKVEEIKHSNCQRSTLSKGSFNPEIYPSEGTGSSLCKINQKGVINRTISKDLFTDLDGEEEEEEIFTPDKENFSPNTLQMRLQKKKGKVEDIKHSKCQRSPLSKGSFNPEIYPTEGTGSSLCKTTKKGVINRTISKDLFSDLDAEEEEEEIFTPDKENFNPHTLQLRKGKVDKIKHSKSSWPQDLKNNFGCPDENMSPTSNKENQTPKGAQDQKLQRKPFSSHIKLAQEQDVMKNRVERAPFQSLKNSGDKRRSDIFCPDSASKSFNFNNREQILDKLINPSDISVVPKKSWDMIVDATSLMNKESRKALQLLQGLKGTRLIIPRSVIRELDHLKKQFTIFRRISEASLALEWIEECMVKTNWWIHIQSSVDEGRLIAPTPPASPQTQHSEESCTFLLSHKCSMEIASPTVEDHILDFALLYRKNQSDGQLVLLSEDITLKIKCMAEGLLCEPVQEFRESLVNPFSERFLWTNSSPRGQTWSCQDDIVLREKYCRLPLWKSSKGVASGLKLILLHNSQYGH